VTLSGIGRPSTFASGLNPHCPTLLRDEDELSRDGSTACFLVAWIARALAYWRRQNRNAPRSLDRAALSGGVRLSTSRVTAFGPRWWVHTIATYGEFGQLLIVFKRSGESGGRHGG
jgi:hypothetical protein